MFYRNWLYVCHRSELDEARRFRRFDIGSQSLLLVRADDGALRAFYNTCRHRRCELCAESVGRFERQLITCPYHQWSYALDGRLLATTSQAEAPDFDKANHALLEVPLEIRRGAVFVALAADPPDFVFCDEPGWAEHADNADPRFRGGLRAGAETWSQSSRLAGEPLAGLSDEEPARGQSYFVSLPSVFIAARADDTRPVRVLPVGPEETELEVEWLFAPATPSRDDVDLDDVYAFGERVLRQDAEASEMNQRGLHARGFLHGELMPEEYHVKAFHDWLRVQIGNPD